jgi:hypothetical protein
VALFVHAEPDAEHYDERDRYAGLPATRCGRSTTSSGSPISCPSMLRVRLAR